MCLFILFVYGNFLKVKRKIKVNYLMMLCIEIEVNIVVSELNIYKNIYLEN